MRRAVPWLSLAVACAPAGDAAPGNDGDTVVASESDAPLESDALPGRDSGGLVDTDPPPPGPRWGRLAPLRLALQEHGAAWLAGELVVLGGFTANGRGQAAPTPRVEAWDPSLDRWRPLQALPEPLHHPNVAVVDGRLYVTGFLVDADFAPRGDVFVYDPDRDAWSEGTPMPEGTERGASVVFVHEERIHVVGGIGPDGASAAMSVYDPARSAWEELEPMRVARDHAGAAVIDGVLYVAGGRALAFDAMVDDVEAWDPVGGWRTVASLPRPRAGVAAGAVGGRLYVLGGEGNAQRTDDLMFADVDVFDPVVGSWTSLDPMPTPVHGAPGAVRDQRMLIPGGAIRAGFAPGVFLTVFDPRGE